MFKLYLFRSSVVFPSQGTSGMEVRSMAFSAPCYPSEESVPRSEIPQRNATNKVDIAGWDDHESRNGGTLIAGWFIMEHPNIKWMIWG